MAVTFTPGGANDDALTTLVFFQSHCASLGRDLSAHDESAQEQAIRRGTVWVEGLGARSKELATRWPGKKASSAQRRQFPRAGGAYVDGTPLDPETVPAAVQEAVCEAAYFHLIKPGVLDAAISLASQVSARKLGPLSQTFEGAGSVEDVRTVLTTVEDLLAPIFVRPVSGGQVWLGAIGS
ncbi:MAG: hypothetical protein JXR13_15105 [Thalassovita sp.]